MLMERIEAVFALILVVDAIGLNNEHVIKVARGLRVVVWCGWWGARLCLVSIKSVILVCIYRIVAMARIER